MKQDELLLEQVSIAEEILAGRVDAERALRMAGLVLALNEHMMRGGSLPYAWLPEQKATLPPPEPGEEEADMEWKEIEWPEEPETSVDVDLEGL